MALINCPECNKEVSDKATSCIHCGCPLSSVTVSKAQKSKLKIIIPIIVVLVICIGVTIYFLLFKNGDDVSDTVSNIDVESVVEDEDKNTLSEDEQLVFEALLIGIKNEGFYNPASVRILEAEDIFRIPVTDSFPNGGMEVVVRIQAENRMGGTLNELYSLKLTNYHVITNSGRTDFEIGDMSNPYRDMLPSKNTLDIGAINNAIIEHYEGLGIR